MTTDTTSVPKTPMRALFGDYICEKVENTWERISSFFTPERQESMAGLAVTLKEQAINASNIGTMIEDAAEVERVSPLQAGVDKFKSERGLSRFTGFFEGIYKTYLQNKAFKFADSLFKSIIQNTSIEVYGEDSYEDKRRGLFPDLLAWVKTIISKLRTEEQQRQARQAQNLTPAATPVV